MNNRIELTKSMTGGFTDVDVKKGITCGYLSTFDDEDTDGDVIKKGAFVKSVLENGPTGTGRIKHLLDHYKVIGKFQKLNEDSKGLAYESLITKAPRGVDYLIMCEEGIITEHSFMGYGIQYEPRNPKDRSAGHVYKEIMLKEGSSMELWGANPNAKMTAIKGEMDITLALKTLEKALKIGSLSDETLSEFTELYKMLKASDENTQPPKSTAPNSDGGELITYLKTLTTTI